MFSLPMRIYYEDTDAAGVVYYANYLKFAERARTEWLRSMGIGQADMMARDGLGFVVSKLDVAYKAPARLDDEIHVDSTLRKIGKVRIGMQQIIRKGAQELVTLQVDIACVNQDFSPARLPASLHDGFAKYAP